MGVSGDDDAVLVGGPRHETLFEAQGASLVQLEIDGLLHRYVRTPQERDRDGRTLRVYIYGGAVDPGAQSGVEIR